MQSKYPQDFFNINNPSAPWTAIQFRTQISNQGLKDANQWQSITINPSNHFDNLTIEDQGGVYNLQLSLFDKNYASLENAVIKALFVGRTANKLVQEETVIADEEEYFQFFVSRESGANLRLRIGYSEWQERDRTVIDETDFNGSGWLNRISNESPVVRSPWIYFQISGADFNLTEAGLRINIKAFSVMSNFIDKARLVQRYAVLKGTPANVIKNIIENIQIAANAVDEKVEYELVGKQPLGYPDVAAGEGGEDPSEGIIEVLLGGEPVFQELPDGTRKLTRQFKRVRTLLNEVCAKVRPILYDNDGNIIEPTYDTSSGAAELEKENENIDKTAPYKWMVVEEPEKITIRFYYQDPNEQIKTQTSIRVYPWLEFGQSIIKNLDIKGDSDFAMLNLQVASVGSNGEMSIHLAKPRGAENNSEDDQDHQVDYTIGRLQQVNDALSNDDFRALFVSDVYETQDFEVSNGRISSQQAAVALSRQLITNLNRQVFRGTITIPGDPFYFFDSAVEPFKYLIKVVVKRPEYIDSNGAVVQGGVSYLSGLYIIGKITHTLGGSGYETRLEILKWPRKAEGSSV